MLKINERDFYKPIKKYFETVIARDYSYQLLVEETHGTISIEIKNLYPNIQSVSNLYNYCPDLVVIDKSNNNNLWIIEVKDDPLKLTDIYQVKRYSEITKANISFLISPETFIKEDEQLIKNEEIQNIKNFYRMENKRLVSSRIIIGKISYHLDNNEIIIDNIYFDNDF